MKASIILGVGLLLQGTWGVIIGFGRNWTFRTKEEFAAWHPKYGRTVKALGVWGIVIGSVVLGAGIFDVFR
jgi:hypothetical protein